MKQANYTAEQITYMTETYTGKDNKSEVAAIAETVGKSQASVRAKLANLGLYVKAEATATAKGNGITKATIAEAIATEAGLSEAEVEGLTKATKSALEKVLARLTNA